MLQGTTLNIKRSERKTLSIYIERDGSVSIFAPASLDDAALESVIKKKEYQIYKHLAEWELLNASKVQREVVNGQSYLYLGRNYRLEQVKDQGKPLLLKNGNFLLRSDWKEKARQLFIELYKEKGLRKIVERVNYYQGKVGVSPKDVRVVDLKNRWASCSAKGNLNFHWKCMMAPLSVIDYIIVHELGHLIHKNHTKAFWNEIDKILPRYHEQIVWLRLHGAGIDL
jgi:hypothetical protein